MTEFQIKSDDIDVSDIADLRIRSLESDPDAFGELHSTAVVKSQRDWEEWLAERANGVDRKLFLLLQNGNYVGMCLTGSGSDCHNH